MKSISKSQNNYHYYSGCEKKLKNVIILTVEEKKSFICGGKLKKIAFTLAETLIALVVIGVISAITIPTLQIQHQKEQTIVQLKKVFSDLSRAVSMARTEYGDPISWDYSLNNNEFFNEYLYPFVQLSTQTIQEAKDGGITYKQLSGQVENSLLIMRNQGRIVELMSGCQIFTYPLAYSTDGTTRRKCYAVDINGYRNPNKFGRDLFMFCLDGDKGTFVPHSWNDNEKPGQVKRTREQLKKGPSSFNYNCSKKARGMWCAALIMADGWEIRDDYPW